MVKAKLKVDDVVADVNMRSTLGKLVSKKLSVKEGSSE